jgi:hypothetical protein
VLGCVVGSGYSRCVVATSYNLGLTLEQGLSQGVYKASRDD